jgi:hypothetical protein
MKRIEFWIKVSNYAITFCGLALIAKMFFRKYLELFIVPILIFGVISFLVFAFSELMKMILKSRQ